MNFIADMRRAVLAGAYISLAGLAYLKIGGPLGAVLFGLGLLGVIQSESLLYTGRIYYEKSFLKLGLVILGNVIGCFAVGMMARYAFPDVIATAEKFIAGRVADSLLACCIKGAFCGMVMTTAVVGGKKNHWCPLLLGIPFFILSGFYHSIADAFYFMVSPTPQYALPWLAIVVGNWIGGKMFFLCKPKE